MNDDILEVSIADLDFAKASLLEDTAFHRVILQFAWPTAMFPGNTYISIKHEFIKEQPIRVLKKLYRIVDWEVRYDLKEEVHRAKFFLVTA